MSTTSLHHTVVIPASPAEVYAAYTDPKLHAEFTGADATGEPKVGETFTAWSGYIEGTYLDIEPGKRVVQSWRTTEWPEDVAPSKLELIFTPAEDGGTTITMNHTEVPEEQADEYDAGWHASYWEPMTDYFTHGKA